MDCASKVWLERDLFADCCDRAFVSIAAFHGVSAGWDGDEPVAWND